MTKHSETDTMKSTGTAYRPPPNQLLPILFKRQRPEETAEPTSRLVYAESLDMSQPENVLVSPANLNPNRVRCPLCRRINTVSLVSANAGKQVTSDFRCSYDGCRGLEWSQ